MDIVFIVWFHSAIKSHVKSRLQVVIFRFVIDVYELYTLIVFLLAKLH